MEGNSLNYPQLVTNGNELSFYNELTASLQTCNSFYFSVAFVSYSGLQLLLDEFNELKSKNVRGKIITSTYLNFTDVKSLKKLQRFDNIDTKIYVADKYNGFHTKGYIFEYDDYYKIIIGSSNITQNALKTNVEWNVLYQSKGKDDDYVVQVIEAFNNLWDITDQLNDEFINQYESFLNSIKQVVVEHDRLFELNVEIKPNKMQLQALENLKQLRDSKQDKALIIAATGTGKTYLSTFDVKAMNAQKVLFVVHRDVILNDAQKSFSKVHPNKTCTIFQGSNKNTKADFTFAMIQTLSREDNIRLFAPDTFDYIIMDEAHHCFSQSYRKILEYFTPTFLLGMTATPERTDGGNIFSLFNNNIALEVRLRDALEEDLVIPFHYFGISDVTTNLDNVDLTKIDELADLLSIRERVDLVIEKVEYYGHSGEKRKCLCFCANIEHAKYMAEEFNSFDYASEYLTGSDSKERRLDVINRLESLNDPLEFVFTIDIFNEGVDIPSVNMVLMLRPTQSPIVFSQQLGRGLRKFEGKEFLTVLDFVGNHNKSFLIPIALSGSKYYDKDSLKVQVTKDFSDIPGCSNIKLDRLVKEQILRQLELVNFSNMKYLRKEYADFKNSIGTEGAPEIIDFYNFDNSPDPIKFIAKEKSYFEFSSKMEKETVEAEEIGIKVLRVIDKLLPVKRISDIVILKVLFENQTINLHTAKEEVDKLVVNVSLNTIKHSFKYLSSILKGAKESKQFWFIEGNGDDQLAISDNIYNGLSKLHKIKILSSIQYGILRYQEEYGKAAILYPGLSLYEHYTKADICMLSEFNKSLVASREGVFKNNDNYNHIYLYVNLHKGEDVQKSIAYADLIHDRFTMQWESQNASKSETGRGYELCNHKELDIKLHMLLRKSASVGGQDLDYTYVGTVSSLSYENEKPIKFQFKFDTPLPKVVFDDLTFRVE